MINYKTEFLILLKKISWIKRLNNFSNSLLSNVQKGVLYITAECVKKALTTKTGT